MRKMNKKGASEQSIWTVIVIIIAVILLVMFVFWITGGGGSLMDRLKTYFGGSNVDSIKQSCQVACDTQTAYEYCNSTKTMKVDAEITDINPKTGSLYADADVATHQVKSVSGTCKQFSLLYPSLGVPSCANLCA
jgi:hypothetical protein